jgi:hypothetical protein
VAKRLPELRALLERIWSGELNHDQDSFFSTNACGTAACVCGWDFALDKFKSVDDAKEMFYNKDTEINPWKYSREKYELTWGESWLLFSTESTKLIQQETLKMMELGGCFEGEGEIESQGYLSEATVIFYPHKKDSEYALFDFFENSSLQFEMINY